MFLQKVISKKTYFWLDPNPDTKPYVSDTVPDPYQNVTDHNTDNKDEHFLICTM